MKYLITLLTVFLMTGTIRTFAAPPIATPEHSATPEYTVIDVRTSEEYSESHVKNALNIDFKSADFETQIAKLDRNKTYKLYCRSGNRSGKALEIMKAKGFQQVENLGGLKDAVEKLHAVCEGKSSC